MVKKLMGYLLAVFLVDYAIELSEVGYAYFEQGHHWTIIGPLLSGPLFNSYVIGQMGALSLLPMVLLGFVAWGKLGERAMMRASIAASFLLALQVLFMRFNVAIGGQLVSKSDRGFVDFHFEFLGREGILAVLIVSVLPFITYYFVSHFFIPVFDKREEDTIS